ncbi:putative quinol monooxygenase [Streptomyces sp. TLI_171]|uniref:putative quinol monooxygenase n=1 Tax=Streptomyces sp. TLI_171 TaxID=1938859 RepID=UPI000C17ACEB|nr:antibiotic biosynthesis monooxygenase [Streptomyces sp. TLI_171]
MQALEQEGRRVRQGCVPVVLVEVNDGGLPGALAYSGAPVRARTVGFDLGAWGTRPSCPVCRAGRASRCGWASSRHSNEPSAAAATGCREEPGCLSYEVFRSEGSPERYVSIEKYVDPAAFAAHRAADHFREIGAARLMPLTTARDVRMYDQPFEIPPAGR